MILNIETSTDCCSAALTHEGEILEERIEKQNMNHARLIAPFADECMAYARARGLKPEAVAVSIGPGSYTGLRIGLSEAKGLAYALDIPLIGISTLKLMAVSVMFSGVDIPDDAIFVPMIDARRMEVYTAAFDMALGELMAPRPLILDENSYADLLSTGRPVLFFGNGMEKAIEVLRSPNARFIHDVNPLAVDMLALADLAYSRREFIDLAYSVPEYLKDFQATTPKNKVI